MLLVLIVMIALQIAFYVSKEWLTNFACQIKFHPGLFISVGILALLITLLTVSYQTIKAALINSVKSLRSQ